jgi:hypothetical protein
VRATAVFGKPLLGFGSSSALLKVGKTLEGEKVLGDNKEYEGVVRGVRSIEPAVSSSWKKISIESIPRNEASSDISSNSVGMEVVVLDSPDSKSNGSGVDTARD